MFAINYEAASQAPPLEILSISLSTTATTQLLNFHIPLYDLLHGPNRPITRIGHARLRVRNCETSSSRAEPHRSGSGEENSQQHYRNDSSNLNRTFEIKVQEEIINVIPHFVFNVRWVDDDNDGDDAHGGRERGKTTTQSSVLVVRPLREIGKGGLGREEVMRDQVVQGVGEGGFAVYIKAWKEV